MVRLTKAELESIFYKLQASYKEFWSKELREFSSQELAELCMKHLVEWGLGEHESEASFLVSPVLGRWQAEYANTDFDKG